MKFENVQKISILESVGIGSLAGNYTTQPITHSSPVDIFLCMIRKNGNTSLLSAYLETYNETEGIWEIITTIAAPADNTEYFETFSFDNVIGTWRIRCNIGVNLVAASIYICWINVNFK